MKRYLLLLFGLTSIFLSCNFVDNESMSSKYLSYFSKRTPIPSHRLDTVMSFSSFDFRDVAFLDHLEQSLKHSEASYLLSHIDTTIDFIFDYDYNKNIVRTLNKKQFSGVLEELFRALPVFHYKIFGVQTPPKQKGRIFAAEYSSSANGKDIVVQMLFVVEKGTILDMKLY